MSSACFFLVLLIPISANCYVKTNQGLISGTTQTFNGVKVERFLGIPYAQPPVGNLRFRKPVQLTKPWSGFLRATNWPSSCQQATPYIFLMDLKNPMISEDCLYLNIWAPKKGLPTNVQTRKALKPVLVYIHGGAYIMGSSTQAIYDGLALSAIGDLVLVTFNYRLGVLGFLYSGTAEIPGNVAIHDQVLALKWIHKNINDFGGDPSRITIFGESAGGISVGLHLLSPVSRNLFGNAVLMSGSPLNTQIVEDKSEALKKSVSFAKLVGCARDDEILEKLNSSVITCLRHLDVKTIIAQQTKVSVDSMPYVPLHGDELFPEKPDKLIADILNDPKTRHRNIMVGVLNYDGSTIEDGLSNYNELAPILKDGTKDEWRAAMETKVNQLPKQPKQGNFSAQLANYYFENAGESTKEYRRTFAEAFGDYYLVCPTINLGRKFAASSLYKVNGYFMTYRSKSRASRLGYNLLCDEDHGKVCHATELMFVFGVPLLKPLSGFNADDLRTSREMIDIWTGFAISGSVNWPAFHAIGDVMVSPKYQINPLVTEKISFDYKHLTCQIWEAYLY